MRYLFVLLMIYAPLTHKVYARPPTGAEIQQWFERGGSPLLVMDMSQIEVGNDMDSIQNAADALRSADPTRDLYWLDTRESLKVRLVGGEIAYLLRAAGGNRGRNAPNPIMILRPSKHLACFDSTQTIENLLDVMDLDNDGVSEIIGDEGSGGGGRETRVRFLFQIKECETIVLHKAIEENNEGFMGRNSWRYDGRFVQWEFVDINEDGIKDLPELRVFEEGREAREPVVTKSLYRYVFIDGAMVRYLEYLKTRPNRN